MSLLGNRVLAQPPATGITPRPGAQPSQASWSIFFEPASGNLFNAPRDVSKPEWEELWDRRKGLKSTNLLNWKKDKKEDWNQKIAGWMAIDTRERPEI